MDIASRIQQLEELIKEAKSMPLSASVLVNKDELLELVDELRGTLPEEIRQARWMSRDRDELLGRARKEAERIIAEAREQRDRLLSRTEIVHAAEREAERITDDAKERSAKMRLEAEDYIDQKLAGFEILLNKTIATVERGRAQLQGEKHSSVQMPTIDANERPPATSGPFDAAELQEPAV